MKATLVAFKRDTSLDFLRGNAIFFMILTHVIVLHYQGDNPTIQFFSWWGGTVCFTIFLFVFSAVIGLKLAAGKFNVWRELLRSLILLIGYYVVAIWVYFFNEGHVDSATISRIPDILTLRLQPEYVEFIIAFMLFVWLAVALKPAWIWLVQRSIPWLLVVVAVYVWSTVLYQYDWGGGYAEIIKAQLVGDPARHTFPVLAYFPIFALGMWWGYFIKSTKATALIWGGVGFITTFGTLVALLTLRILPIERWPPTLSFMLIGLSYAFFIITLYPILRFIPLVPRFIRFVGRHPFEYFLYHLILLLPFRPMLNLRTLNEPYTLLTFGLTVGLSTYLILIKASSR